ncbi:hypothetical protein [Peijinzhouia sedimentorum]
MIRKFSIVFIILLVLGVSAFFLWDKLFPKSIDNSWSLIPENALIVYETDDLVKSWNEWESGEIWKILEEIPSVGSIRDNLDRMDSLTGRDGSLDRILRGKKFLASLHTTSRNEFDFLFNFPYPPALGDGSLQKVLDSYSAAGFQVSERNHRGYTLREVTHPSNGDILTLLSANGFLSVSFTPFLVEDVVRLLDDTDSRQSFDQSNAQIFKYTNSQNPFGNFYFNLKRLDEFASIFSASGTEKWLASYKAIANTAILQVSQEENRIRLRGISETGAETEQNFLNTFSNQSKGDITIGNLIPKQTGYFLHYYLSDFEDWQSKLQAYWEVHHPNLRAGRQAITDKYNTSLSNFAKWTGTEVSLIWLNSLSKSGSPKLAIVDLADVETAMTELDRFGMQVEGLSGDTLYRERFGDLDIRLLNVPEVPYYWLGEAFSGFSQSYYAEYDNKLLISNEIEVLKQLMRDIEEGSTWDTNKRGWDSQLSTANITSLVHTPNLWNILLANMAEPWTRFFTQNEAILLSFERAFVQLGNSNGDFETEISLEYVKPLDDSNKSLNYTVSQRTVLGSKITSRPIQIRNLQNGQLETFMQTEDGNLFIIGQSGEIILKRSIGSAIISDIFPIDFYKNGDTQYLFITENNIIHLIDRQGNYVGSYPDRPDNMQLQVKSLNVLDYDNSKNYNLLITDAIGNIFLYDQFMTNLEGWQPVQLNGLFSQVPFHLSVRTRDYIIASQARGFIHVMDKDGLPVQGFPIDIKGRLGSSFFIEYGNTAANTLLTTITEEGEIIQFNLQGNITKREQLIKPNRDSKFYLINDEGGRTYTIVRQDFNQLSFLDKDGKTRFQTNLVAGGTLSFQYYYFAPGQEVFVVNDPVQEFSYLYSSEGKLIKERPLESSHSILVHYISQNGTYRVFTNYLDQALVFSFEP